MEKKLHFIIPIILLVLGSACKKDNNNKFTATADLYVVNASVGNGSIKVNPNVSKGFSYKTAADITYGSSGLYPGFTGSNIINVVSSTDTTKTFFNRTVDLQPISTLYIAGQTPNVDTLFRVENNFPYINATKLNPDSSIYVRFVNLSPNSTPLNINIKLATANEATALTYKGITTFKKYAAISTSADYIFEIRDANTNLVLVTYTLSKNTNRFKTISIVLKGLVGTTGTTAFSAFQINYV